MLQPSRIFGLSWEKADSWEELLWESERLGFKSQPFPLLGVC